MVTGWIVGVRENEPEIGVVVGVVAVVVVLPGVLPVVVTVVYVVVVVHTFFKRNRIRIVCYFRIHFQISDHPHVQHMLLLTF